MAMGAGVHKSELNWNTYQEKQLDVLTELRDSFKTSLSLGKSSEQSLSRIYTSLNDVARSLGTISNKFQTMFPELQRGAEKTTRAMSEAADAMNSKKIIIDQFGNSVDLAAKAAKESAEQEERASKARAAREEALKLEEEERKQRELDEKAFLQERKATIKQLGREALAIMQSIGRIANNYSEASNNLIKFTSSGSDVQAFRSNIMSNIISQLNKETGYYYNGVEAYSQMVSIANSAGIGSLDALKELTRPILLAQEAIDVNISDMAKLLGKWSTRYSFNSAQMETLVNDIRGYTADNNASAEAALKNIETLENWAVYNSNQDPARLSAAIEDITKMSSWFESMGVDSTRYTDIILKLLEGDDDELSKLVPYLGSNYNLAKEMANNQQYSELGELLFQTDVSNWDRLIEGATLKKAVSDRFGFDFNSMLDAKNAYESEGFTSLSDFVITKSSETAVDAVESKYVSFEDKVDNWLSQLYEKVSNIQEKLGFGLTDIVKGITSIIGIISIAKGLGIVGKGGGSGLLGKLGQLLGLGGGSAGGAGGSALVSSSTLSTAASVLGSLALAGGGATFAVGGYKSLTDKSNTTGNNAGTKALGAGEMVAGGVAAGAGLAGAAGAAGLITVGASVPVVGWIALAAAGLFAFGKAWHKAATTVGTADGITARLEEAKKMLARNNADTKDKLWEIQGMLDDETKLEEARSELINSGLLNEEDVELARKANIEGLKRLTDAYLTATDKMTDNATDFLSKYGQQNAQYGKSVHGELEEVLQKYNDDVELTDEHVDAFAALFNSLYKSLDERKSSGESFDKQTQKVYDKLKSGYESGWDTKSINKVVDAGFWNTAFQNSDLGVEAIEKAMNAASRSNDTGAAMMQEVRDRMGGDLQYYGSEDKLTQLSILYGKISASRSSEEVQSLFNQISELGYHSGTFTELDDLATKWGIGSYALGSNYIDRDQLAYLHTGESITPARYNPAANMNELEYLRKESASNKRENENQNIKYFSDILEVMKETKELINNWKTESVRETRKNSTYSRLSANNTSLVTNPR